VIQPAIHTHIATYNDSFLAIKEQYPIINLAPHEIKMSLTTLKDLAANFYDAARDLMLLHSVELDPIKNGNGFLSIIFKYHRCLITSCN
jgi:hypothetical protein